MNLQSFFSYDHLVNLLVFTNSIICFRAVDYLHYRKDETKIYTNNWPPYSPRMLSVGLLAWAYVFSFFDVLSLTRTSRILGPLRISLAKMLVNILEFFAIFSLLFFAFAIGLTELFLNYDSSLKECSKSSGDKCNFFPFSNIIVSLKYLFWALFGYLDALNLFNDVTNSYISMVGLSLIAVFHVSMLLILLNMLIAMMTQSYEKTNENKDAEFNFYRTQIWIRFIKNDYSRPPPMNLLPDFALLNPLLKRFKPAKFLPRFVEKFSDVSKTENEEECSKKRLEVSLRLLHRYKMKYLLNDNQSKTELKNDALQEELVDKVISLIHYFATNSSSSKSKKHFSKLT